MKDEGKDTDTGLFMAYTSSFILFTVWQPINFLPKEGKSPEGRF